MIVVGKKFRDLRVDPVQAVAEVPLEILAAGSPALRKLKVF